RGKMSIQNRIRSSSCVCVLQRITHSQVFHEQHSFLLPGQQVSTQVWLRLNDSNLRTIQTLQHLSLPVNLHPIKEQLFEARIERKPEAARVLYSGFIFHQPHNASKS